MESQHRRTRIFCSESFGHDLVPDSTARPELCDFLEEIVMAVPEERQAGGEVIDIKTGVNSCLHVGNGIRQGKCDFLNRSRASLSNVVARDRDRVPLRDVF